jgi:hypothetical protein
LLISDIDDLEISAEAEENDRAAQSGTEKDYGVVPVY